MDPELTYLILCRTNGSDAAIAHERRLRRVITRSVPVDFDRVVDEDGLLILVDPARNDLVRSASGRAILIGTMFDRRGERLRPAVLDRLVGRWRDSADMASAIVGEIWGRYLAVLRLGDRGAPMVLRDPMGAQPVTHVADGGLSLLAGTLPAWLVAALDRRISVDLERVARTLLHPPYLTYASLLRGAELIPGGALVAVDGATPPAMVWHPIDHVAGRPMTDPREAAALLRSQVELCGPAWAKHHGDILLELSGGLDSAILLGALAGAGRITAANFSSVYAEGDERGHARAAAAMHDTPLVELTAEPDRMDYRALLTAVPSAAPRLYGLDPQHERLFAELAMRAGARAIATGQGGDALFLQMPTPLIAVDHARAHGWPSVYRALVAARRGDCSVWRVMALIARDRLGRPAAGSKPYDQQLLAPGLRARLGDRRPRHPWLDGLDGVPPGKQLQIEAIANCQLFFLPTGRGRTVPLIHPLLSQPVIEAVLAIPTHVLAPDDRDRGLARDAFADRLPASIRQRRGKGEASRYYSRAVVANLPFLRELLLDGELAKAGLLDRAALEIALDEDHLLWADAARPPILYASVEAWLRHWRAQ